MLSCRQSSVLSRWLVLVGQIVMAHGVAVPVRCVSSWSMVACSGGGSLVGDAWSLVPVMLGVRMGNCASNKVDWLLISSSCLIMIQSCDMVIVDWLLIALVGVIALVSVAVGVASMLRTVLAGVTVVVWVNFCWLFQ